MPYSSDPRVLRCPSCGAPLPVGQQVRGTCRHCGSTIDLGRANSVAGRGGRRPRPAPWRLGPRGRRVLIVLGALSIALAGLFFQMFYTYTARSAFGDEAIASALALGICGIFWALAGWRIPGILFSLLGGLLLISKPFLYPMISDAETGRTFSLNSETHLNFLLPGIALVVLAVLLAAIAWGRKNPRQAVS